MNTLTLCFVRVKAEIILRFILWFICLEISTSQIRSIPLPMSEVTESSCRCSGDQNGETESYESLIEKHWNRLAGVKTLKG